MTDVRYYLIDGLGRQRLAVDSDDQARAYAHGKRLDSEEWAAENPECRDVTNYRLIKETREVLYSNEKP